MRTQYLRMDENNWEMDLKQMVNVFDPVIQEMFGFLRASYIRFECAN